MYFKSKKTSLLILGITSIACSRAMFFFFDDPEGPNLLVVMVMAAIIYFLSLTIFIQLFNNMRISTFSHLSLTGLTRLLIMIVIQMILVVAFYFCLN